VQILELKEVNKTKSAPILLLSSMELNQGKRRECYSKRDSLLCYTREPVI